MRLTIYTTQHARSVEPGTMVDGGDAGPILVDKVELHLPDAPQPVVLLGRRPGAPSNVRRRALRFEHGDEVRVLPTADVAEAVWKLLVEAVWIAGGDDATPGAPVVPEPAEPEQPRRRPAPYRVVDGIVQVRHGHAWYSVVAEPDPEPASDPEDGPAVPSNDPPDPDPEQ